LGWDMVRGQGSHWRRWCISVDEQGLVPPERVEWRSDDTSLRQGAAVTVGGQHYERSGGTRRSFGPIRNASLGSFGRTGDGARAMTAALAGRRRGGPFDAHCSCPRLVTHRVRRATRRPGGVPLSGHLVETAGACEFACEGSHPNRGQWPSRPTREADPRLGAYSSGDAGRPCLGSANTTLRPRSGSSSAMSTPAITIIAHVSQSETGSRPVPPRIP